MKRTIENVGFPKEDGFYLIRFAPYYEGESRMGLDSGMCRVAGDRWPSSVWERLHPKDMWIKLYG